MCGEECDGERGCYIAKGEQGRFLRIQKARSICERCPVRTQCLDWALDNNEPFGVWGGTTERDRRNILKARRDDRKAAK